MAGSTHTLSTTTASVSAVTTESLVKLGIGEDGKRGEWLVRVMQAADASMLDAHH